MYIDCCCFAGNKKNDNKIHFVVVVVDKNRLLWLPWNSNVIKPTTKSTNQSINQPQMTTEKIKNHLNKLGNIFEEEKFGKKTDIQIDSK